MDDIVVAIDLGTSRTAYSYTVRGEDDQEGPRKVQLGDTAAMTTTCCWFVQAPSTRLYGNRKHTFSVLFGANVKGLQLDGGFTKRLQVDSIAPVLSQSTQQNAISW